MSKQKHPRTSKRRISGKLVEAFAQYAHDHLLGQKTEVELPPEEIELREWLSNDLVEGKFIPWWHQKIAMAKRLDIPFPPIWNVLASLFDRVFPGTCNQFNEFNPRTHVTEEVLYAYLEHSHRLSIDECKKLRLCDLAGLLQGDLEKALGVCAADDNERFIPASDACKLFVDEFPSGTNDVKRYAEQMGIKTRKPIARSTGKPARNRLDVDLIGLARSLAKDKGENQRQSEQGVFERYAALRAGRDANAREK